MKNLLIAGLLGLALTACRAEPAAPTDSAPAAGHDHASLATHGGSIVELGDHAALLEIVRDESAGTVAVYVMDAAGAVLSADAAPVLNVPTDDAPLQLEGTENDGAWTFSDEALTGHVHGARLRVTIGGRTFNPELPDSH